MPPTAGEKFQKLIEILARLRAPGGCPWDREQTFDTIKPFLLEETYEVLDAMESGDASSGYNRAGVYILDDWR